MTTVAEVRVIFDGKKEHMPSLNRGQYQPHFRISPEHELLGVVFISGSDVDEYDITDLVNAKVGFLYEPDVSYKELSVGTKFEIVEGNVVVGHGKILQILPV